MKNIDAGAITRLIILLLSLINTALSMSGKNPIPYSETDVGVFISLLITGLASIQSYWKNNNWTVNAKKAQEFKKQLDKDEVVTKGPDIVTPKSEIIIDNSEIEKHKPKVEEL